MADEINYYILFANYTQGLALHDLLKREGLKARIAPTPRSVQGELSCGMSLLVLPEDIAEVCRLVDESGIEILGISELPRNIDPRRDRYC